MGLYVFGVMQILVEIGQQAYIVIPHACISDYITVAVADVERRFISELVIARFVHVLQHIRLPGLDT